VKRVATLGIETAVFERGSGPPILLLHGNPDTHHVWDPLVERLEAKHRCVTPDLPGYGETRIDDSFDFSVANQGAWVNALVEVLGLGRVHLGVHDVGGAYGLSFAAQFPEKLASLTIFNAGFTPDQQWHFWARVWRAPVLGELAMKLSTRGLFVSEMLKGGPKLKREYAEEAWKRYTPETRRQVLRWYRFMTFEKVLAGWDTRLRSAIANVPRRVLWGARDPYIPTSVRDRFEVPDVHEFADCGHWVMLEAPDEAARDIAELVNRS
jgi:pimeloyl-ACP methyl ester carboxylesterase